MRQKAYSSRLLSKILNNSKINLDIINWCKCLYSLSIKINQNTIIKMVNNLNRYQDRS